jgi:general secretion pathway protein J
MTAGKLLWRRTAASEGFTLIEMLVAITLMALLSVMLFEGMRLGSRSTAVSAAMNDRSGQWSLTYGVLRNQLAGAESLPVKHAPPPPPADFTGTVDGVSFVEQPPAYLAPGGLYRAHLSFVRGARSGRLMLSWVRLGAADSAGDPPPTTLLDNLANADFSYFGALAPDQAPEWLQSWEGVDHLPTLVRLRVAFADGERPPDLIVALRLAPLPRSDQ